MAMFRGTVADDVGKALKLVLEKIEVACAARPAELRHTPARLVAVSKTQPVSMIVDAYAAGQRHFGENYIQELTSKSNHSEIRAHCPGILWHFIGKLQRNKISKLLGCHRLYMVETLDSQKLATALNDALGRQSVVILPLRVYVQINTSQEETKNGCDPSEVITLVDHVLKHCPNLLFCGLMTIGSFEHSVADTPNPDFQSLVQFRTQVCQELGLEESEVGLSMGMSHDFESAIASGSTNVRVGSLIFGNRAAKPA